MFVFGISWSIYDFAYMLTFETLEEEWYLHFSERNNRKREKETKENLKNLFFTETATSEFRVTNVCPYFI